jgi:hypothetical protein
LNDDSKGAAPSQSLLRRASVLSARAGALERSQAQYEGQVARQVSAIARSAARLFDQLGLPDFANVSLPAHARYARNVRQKTLCYLANADADTAVYRAVLLGSDGRLRLYTARSPLASLPGAPAAVYRDVVDWSAQRAVPGLTVTDVMAALDAALDNVEQHVMAEERRLAEASAALASRPDRVEQIDAARRNAHEPVDSAGADLFSGPFASLRQYVSPPPK